MKGDSLREGGGRRLRERKVKAEASWGRLVVEGEKQDSSPSVKEEESVTVEEEIIPLPYSYPNDETFNYLGDSERKEEKKEEGCGNHAKPLLKAGLLLTIYLPT